MQRREGPELLAPHDTRRTAPVMPTRLLAWFVAALFLVLGALPGDAVLAATAPAVQGWRAVLVAGDRAEPVFDNATGAMQQFLTAHGVPAESIRRLSASIDQPSPAGDPATLARVLQDIATMHPQPGEGCFVFITSHGQHGEGVWLAREEQFLAPAALAKALDAGCGRAPTVVIVSACYSGSFAAAPVTAPNRIVLTAARPDRPSFGCQVGRTYTIYDECLLAALPQAPRWRAAFAATNACVTRHEREMQVLPSQPRASFGAAVKDLALR